MSAQKTLITADELLRLPAKGYRYELVRGELIKMPPAGAQHGGIAAKIAHRLLAHVEANRLGVVFGAETGFWIHRNPDTVRAPDAAFIANERLPEGGLPAGYFEGAPDLAVEVVSPNDTASEVQAKVEDWLRAGVRLVWVVYPESRSVTVFRSWADARMLTPADTLTGDPVLPGFTCPVQELFP